MFKLVAVFLVCLLISNTLCEESGFLPENCGDPIEFTGPNGESCLGLLPVITWSQAEQRCTTGFYGGCYGSKNRFFSLEECERTARPVCENL